MIEVRDIRKSFDGKEVLKGISTKYEKGKTNLIIGQSGSGKTVMLKTLLGVHTPDSGQILFDGQDYALLNVEEKREIRTQIGMVFQGSALFDSMNVEENIAFPLKMFTQKSDQDIKIRVQEVIERVNLNGANLKMPSEISGGMQKRVAIARAIVNNPKYLFCDEPNSGLDPKTAIVIDELIQEITHEYQMTTVINTHDMNSVLQIGEHIVFLKNGKLVWTGNSQEIMHTENEDIIDFVYSSDLLKEIRNFHNTKKI